MARPTEHSEAKRASVCIRVTPTLSARLRDAATLNNRSQTQEIEHRLAASFDYADAADYVRQVVDTLIAARKP